MKSSEAVSPSSSLAVGRSVERLIDGTWYRGVIKDAYDVNGEMFFDIEYVDDGNSEIEVPATDLRIATTKVPQRPRSERKTDDFDEPVVHLDATDATAFVVNGSATKLGAGTGLHGIRFLRHTVNMR